jgi:ATP synthase protein I
MNDNNHQKSDKKSFIRAYGLYGGVGIQLGVAITGMTMLGKYIDEKLDTMPWFLIVGVILGTAGGFYNLFRLLKKESKS